jgi:hypothetical protein
MKVFKISNSRRGLGGWAALGLAILASGCGIGRHGQYQGTETVHSSFLQTPIRSQAMLTLQEVGNDMVSGTWVTNTATGSFQGILRADRLDIQMMTRGPTNSVNALTNSQPNTFLGAGTTMNNIYSVCQGQYSGTLQFQDRRLVGTLQLVNQQFSSMEMISPCNQIEIDVSRFD